MVYPDGICFGWLQPIHHLFGNVDRNGAHDTSEAAAVTISQFIDKLDAEREKGRTRIEVVLPVEVVRRSEE